MAGDTVSIADRLKAIRASYIKQLPSQLQGIRSAFDAIAEHPAPGPELEALHYAIHTLRGASASFGVAKLAEAAAAAEQLAKEGLQAGPATCWSTRMSQYLALMEREAASSAGEQAAELQASGLSPAPVDTAEVGPTK
jgi:HPt (histidine-containing phosphotransfer) domain-containing protein